MQWTELSTQKRLEMEEAWESKAAQNGKVQAMRIRLQGLVLHINHGGEVGNIQPRADVEVLGDPRPPLKDEKAGFPLLVLVGIDCGSNEADLAFGNGLGSFHGNDGETSGSHENEQDRPKSFR